MENTRTSGSSPSTDPRQDDAEQIIRALLPYVRHGTFTRPTGLASGATYEKDCDAMYDYSGDCECGAGSAVKRARVFLAREARS